MYHCHLCKRYLNSDNAVLDHDGVPFCWRCADDLHMCTVCGSTVFDILGNQVHYDPRCVLEAGRQLPTAQPF